ncbi:MAG: NAD(+)/NADH kinase [Actinomycetota bacterium]|nr:NAD(+)/NADH kinase [Actinomycetota bacterium]
MLVGLVANPTSSKDIRRLTTLARVIDVEEKANIVARLLVGLGSEEGIEVLGVDDQSGLFRRAITLAGSAAPPTGFLPIEVEGTEADTRHAADYLANNEAAALITVGGDGTVRAAAEGWPRAPLVPLAAGTNNAFALTDEPSVVGMATAIAVKSGADAFRPTTAVEAETVEGRALAVIDAVVVRNHWVGSGAIWDPAELVEGFVTTSRRTAVGIASVSAALGPLEQGHARHLRFGGERTVRAVFGPGLILDVPVDSHVDLPVGAELPLGNEAGMVALDGERRLPAKAGLVRVVEGPRVLDLETALRVL